MHPEAYRGAIWAVRRSDLASRVLNLSGNLPAPDTHVRALDLGGADVNGTARPTVTGPLVQAGLFVEWFGWDIEEGPGVDLVVDATKPVPEIMHETFDVVLCTEVLEHVAAWDCVLDAARCVLKAGGVLILTAASLGRNAHGARGAATPDPGEWYANVHPSEVSNVLEALGFLEHAVLYNQNPGDVYAWAVK